MLRIILSETLNINSLEHDFFYSGSIIEACLLLLFLSLVLAVFQLLPMLQEKPFSSNCCSCYCCCCCCCCCWCCKSWHYCCCCWCCKSWHYCCTCCNCNSHCCCICTVTDVVIAVEAASVIAVVVVAVIVVVVVVVDLKCFCSFEKPFKTGWWMNCCCWFWTNNPLKLINRNGAESSVDFLMRQVTRVFETANGGFSIQPSCFNPDRFFCCYEG